MPETMKLFGSTKNKITNNENGKDVLSLEITEVILVYCDIVYNYYQHGSRVLNKVWSKKIIRSVIRYFLNKIYIYKKVKIQSFHLMKYGLLIKILKY